MLPSEEEFPYAIRTVSETFESNGSTSMASTCASCMSLMAAGVPIKKMVAGISCGLVTGETDEDFVLLTDIQGLEDFFGDMDFKVTGTTAGITAIQMDIKIHGLTRPIVEGAYADATGKVPMMPEYGMGFWQCKLRYQTQKEILEVAREYKRRGLPIDVIVADYFHWPHQGDWKFDKDYWPDPAAMVRELKEMGIELMVSIWPTVDAESENYEEMRELGYLTRSEYGKRIGQLGEACFIDVTHPDGRKYVWDKMKKNYYEKGIKIFWLDEAEPEFTDYEFEHYRYFLGADMEVGNIYPKEYARMAYEGMEAEGQKNILNLLRCAWAGSQRYGALVWSGDIDSSFRALRNQLAAGLNMGLSGIPWWTTFAVTILPSLTACAWM